MFNEILSKEVQMEHQRVVYISYHSVIHQRIHHFNC